MIRNGVRSLGTASIASSSLCGPPYWFALGLTGDADNSGDLRAEPRARDHARNAAEGRARQKDLLGTLTLQLVDRAFEIADESARLGLVSRRLRPAEVAVVDEEHPEPGVAQDAGIGNPPAQVGGRLVGEHDARRAAAQGRTVEEDAVRGAEPSDLGIDRAPSAALAESGQPRPSGVQRLRPGPPASGREGDGCDHHQDCNPAH
jgi:hypothetical protein